MSLTPLGSVIGTWSGNTINGQITFSGLRILSANTYTLIAASNAITSANYVGLTIINYVYSITLHTDSLTPSANFDFTVVATLDGEDSALFTGSCTLTLSADDTFTGTSSITTYSGTATFNICFSMPGQKTLTARCPAAGASPSITQALSLTVLSDILTISAPSPTVLDI